ncbi:hypothetical protein AB0E69_27695 [Kribbella sp. NPDC026611]|uniref:hypothetical protein n=1 Tax=Kribbella sp. NPDC026611 TaxID=3154911 RepID=UPI0033CF1F82
MPEEPRKHITEAVGGRFVAPLSHEERAEHERVRTLLRAVMSAYNGLIGTAIDESRRAELEAELAVHTERFRRVVGLSAEERAEVLRTYPDLLARLRADLGE